MSTVNETQIKETIRTTLEQMLSDGGAEFDDDALFYEDVGADSIAIVQVFLTCQETFDVTLADELNLMEPISVNSLTALIERKLDERA
ncbi:acyl carrier protein [Gordonibacter sp. Marseille-P4307]|uniref:acyl carrier protein n=1 Tax=Gordonibacter sp. Marseille-P4307 TaxID=2161815 RepID=UPI000F53496C|nr:acyl carrier protein [Gordonibacter sp. Marseille-P4307]